MEYDPTLADPAVNAAVFDFSKALLRGVGNGLKNTAHLISHPLDSFVYPVSNFLFDASIIVAKGMAYDPEIDKLHRVANSGQFHEGAVGRMRDRIVGAKMTMNDFSKLPLEKQVEVVSEGATSVLVPGGIIKGLKHVANYHRYGTSRLTKFHNTSPKNLVPDLGIKTLSPSDIRKIKNNDLLYVYTEAKELLIAEAEHHTAFYRGPPTKQYLCRNIYHPELAELKPVYAAGEVSIKNGKVIVINNFSGHYAPKGVPAKLIEEAFVREGYTEAIGKYREFVFENSLFDRLPNIAKKGKIPLIPIVALDNDDKIDVAEDDYSEEEDDPLFLKDPTTESAPYFPCAAEFVLQEGDLSDMVTSFSKSRLDLNNGESVVRFSHHLMELSDVGCKISQIALMCGGHKRTWNNVGKAFNGLSQISSGITTMAMGGSILSMAGGPLSMIMGAMSLFSAFSGDNDGDGIGEALQQLSQQMAEMHKEIMSALETIHKTLVEGFQVIEGHILNSVIPRLQEINTKIDRLENITSLSFKELHGQKLVALVDALRKDLVGEISLPNAERKKYARKLGTWIDCDSKSPIQTSLFRISDNEDQLLNVLSGPFEVYDIFPLFVAELNKMCHMKLEVRDIPNIPSFTVAVDLYISYLLKYNDNKEVLVRARDTFIKLDGIIREIADSDCHNILTRQYKHYRFLVGRQIEKCRIEYTNDKRLAEYLKPGPEYEGLLKLFTSMEARRAMVYHLETLLGIPHAVLESKNEILSTTNLLDIVDTNNMRNIMTNYDLAIRSLQVGCSVHSWSESWGQPIHYATKYTPDSRILYSLLKCPDIEINKPTIGDKGDTWGSSCRPILHAMNLWFINHGILLCAQGHNISEYNPTADYHRRDPNHWTGYWNEFHASDLGNSFGSCGNIAPHEAVSASITKSLNDPNSKIYREHLRKAYSFYKQAEAGLLPPVIDISPECLLLLCCAIGDLYPFLYSKLHVNVNMKLDAKGLTYYMIAVFSKSHEVVRYLVDHGADITATLTDSASRDHYIGYTQKYTLQPVIYQVPPIHKPLFRDFVSRIELTLDSSKKEVIDEQLAIILEILKEDLHNILDDKRARAEKCLTFLDRNEDVADNLDMLDTIYLLSNKRNNFGYCLSAKINRYISSLS